jgi:Coenzyme PQQ synthesis protein D (PqqD)
VFLRRPTPSKKTTALVNTHNGREGRRLPSCRLQRQASRDRAMSNPPRIKDIAINETGFVFDPYSGGTYTLNATGQVIIKSLRDGLSPPDIAARLRAEFDGVTEKLDEDLQDFMRSLREFGLLSNSE